MTNFQRTLPQDKETCWQIVKLFHPELEDAYKHKMIARKGNYHWVTIEFRVKGYGQISIGIDNNHNTTLFGNRVTKGMMQSAIKNGDVSFRCWRFSLDRDSIEFKDDYDDYIMKIDQEEEILKPLYQALLKKAGYKLMPVSTWYDLYYED